MIVVDTSTLSNQDIHTALLCHTYTAKADRQIFVRLFADQVAGNGTYTAYLTMQRLGAGSFYEVQPRTAPSVASGVTSIAFTTIPLSVQETDVVKVYLVGLAGDTTTPDIITEVWDADPLTQFAGISQGGGANNTIVLASAGSPATNDLVNGAVIRIRGGTGKGQARAIIGYVVSTKVATIGRNWITNPDNTSAYEIVGLSVPRVDDSLQVYPLNSAGVTSILADYARRTGDYATVAALSTLQGNVTTILADYARRTGDYATVAALATLQGNVTTILADYARRTGDYATVAALATLQGNVTTILADYARRTGDYATVGAAMNLIDALKNKVGTTGYDRTTDSLEALGEGGGGGGSTAADIWTYINRTLSQAAAAVMAAITGSDIAVYKNTTVTFTLTGLADFTGWSKIWFTAKSSLDDADSASIFQIVKSSPAAGTDGLLYINGIAGAAAKGSITVLSTTSITVVLEASEAAKLSAGVLYYDIKALVGTAINAVSESGRLTISDTVTKAIT
jgi:hypothetical protein